MSANPEYNAYLAPPRMAAMQRTATIVGLLGAIASIVGVFIARDQFFRSYLLAFLYWWGISLGALAWLMLQHLTGGMWGFTARRIMEAAGRNILLIALLFIPLIFGMHSLYPWMDPEIMKASAALQHKVSYLNHTWWIVRACFYFAMWGILAITFNRWSSAQDREPLYYSWRYQRLSGSGLVIYLFTMTFASVDWVMSLTPDWRSTIYGLLFLAGQGIVSICFIIVIGLWLSLRPPMNDVFRPKHFHDWGKFLLTFVMLWGYFAFSQLLIIWSGNMPDENKWYLDRFGGGWQYVGLALVIFHFAVPFALLLSRDLKRHGGRLVKVAVIMLVMRYIDLWWWTRPSMPLFAGHIEFHWLDVATMVGMGGIWFATFLHYLRSRPLLPLQDENFATLMVEKEEHA